MKAEHLIYGTFPDLPGSQQVVYTSPGIPSDLRTWLIKFYEGFGDCKNEEFRSSLSVCWFRGEKNQDRAVITKVSHNGKDFSGRWGALLRHSAILTPEQYESIHFDPSALEDRLVSSGTSEELAKSGDLEILESPSTESHLAQLLTLSFDHFKENLLALLRGDRLVLYAENNNDYTNRYLRNLVSLLPQAYKKVVNWSEFVFRSSEELDLSVVYSSRHESPTGDHIKFTSSGENRLKVLSLGSGFVEDYMAQLGGAFAGKELAVLAAIIAAEPKDGVDTANDK